MATCRQVITTARRKDGTVSEGQPAPNAYDAQVALELLISTYLEFVSEGLFGRLTAVEATADLTAEEWQRIRSNGFTVTIPDTITDACTGETRAPKDLALIVVAEASPQYHLFEAQTGAWGRLDGLTLDSYAPLSNRGADGLASLLACKLIEDRGGVPGPVLLQQARKFHGGVSARFDGEATVISATYF